MTKSLVTFIGGVLHAQGYTLLFVGMLFEGPFITAGAAFGAALHYFNPWAIIGLSIAGNLIPDALFYALGYWGRERFIVRYGPYLGITPGRLERLERLYHGHPGKTLLAVKLLPTIATPGLIAAGAARLRLKTYAWWCVAVTAPSSLLYFVIGYYSGATYTKILHYIDYGGYALFGIVILVLGILYLARKVSEHFSASLEKL